MLAKSLLLVDDEEIILRAIKKFIRKENYTISTASGGEEALGLLRESSFDLVITDLVMPGTGGLKVLQEAKSIDPFTTVIILTGCGDMKSAIEALRLGADDFLSKPCDPNELLARMENCLKKQEALRKIKVYEEILPVCSVCGLIRDDRGVEHGHQVTI